MKIFGNYVFRGIIFFAVFGASVFCPLFFFMPVAATFSDKILLAVLVLLGAIAEIILFVFSNYKLLISPMKHINETAKKLSNGEYDARTHIKTADEEVKRLGKITNRIADEFENLEQMRKSFVANASHELRSPLTSMQGFLQAILDGTIAAGDSEKYLRIVLSETKRLNSLITSMLDLSRMESGKYPLTMSRFEINAVLVNLIDNAVKYSPAYSRILVTTHIHGEKIYIAVKDQGFGISKKDQLLIWDRFYMADKARTPNKSKGTGLGLSIVKKIIDDHKEAIRIESNKGAGAAFIFTLTLFNPAKHKVDVGTLRKSSAEK